MEEDNITEKANTKVGAYLEMRDLRYTHGDDLGKVIEIKCIKGTQDNPDVYLVRTNLGYQIRIVLYDACE